MGDTEKKLAAAYVSWKTLENVFDVLKKHGMPDQIDRTVFPGLNWNTQTQLLQTLKFLKLTTDDGKTTPELAKMVEEPSTRKSSMKAILIRCYPKLVALDLAKASPLQVDQTMEQYGVSGATLRKAVRFFLSAAGYAGIPIGPLLKSRRDRSNNGAKKKKNVNSKATASAHTDANIDRGASEQPIGEAVASLLLKGLFQRLPKPGSVWPVAQREQWVQTLQNVFSLEYQEEVKENKKT